MASLKGLGTEDKKKLGLAVVLGLAVIGLAIHTIFGGPAPVVNQPNAASVTAPVAVRGAVARRNAALAGTGEAGQADSGDEQEARILPSGNASMDPKLHPEVMAENENYLYRGTGRNIFAAPAEQAQEAAAQHIETVRAPIRPTQVIPAGPVGPPQPPAINLRFFGYVARQDGTRHAFLLHGDDVDHRYKVVKIAPFNIQVEDLPFNDTQTLPLTQSPL
jgi:hypothetical protein